MAREELRWSDTVYIADYSTTNHPVRGVCVRRTMPDKRLSVLAPIMRLSLVAVLQAMWADTQGIAVGLVRIRKV